MPQRNASALPKLVRPQLSKPESTLAPSQAPALNSPIGNQGGGGDEDFEITPAPTNESPAPEIQYDEQVIMSEIFKSPEFIYAVVATMLENIAHNDPNIFQNK